jgi:hypothetical protein
MRAAFARRAMLFGHVHQDAEMRWSERRARARRRMAMFTQMRRDVDGGVYEC